MRQELGRLILSDRYYFGRHIQLQDGVNIQMATGTGTKFGTGTGQKLGLWNKAPVVQPSAIADLTVAGAAQDSVARQGVNDILTALRQPGMIAT